MVLSSFCRNGVARSFSTTAFLTAAAKPDRGTQPQDLVGNERPETFRIDGRSFKTDTTWNLSPSVCRLLKRRLLSDPSNPLSLLKQRIIDHMHQAYRKSGCRSPLFTVCENEPRVVTTFENFDSLLTPEDHVSRRPSDTYYVNETQCLRAHTSAHQYQLLKEGLNAFIVVGDVYRRDEIDRTHYPCFHQVEHSSAAFMVIPFERQAKAAAG